MPETFGSAIRAGRQRFGYVPEVDCYARLTLVGERICLQVVAPDHLTSRVPSHRDVTGGYAMWYSTDVSEKDQERTRRTIVRAVKETKYWQPGCVIWLNGRGRVIHV